MTSRIESLTAHDLPLKLGRYELTALVGEGAMGRVFRAELQGPAGFRKPVALKLIRNDAMSGRASRDMLIREARVGGLLRHPNIVDVYDFGEVEEQLYIAMELVEGVPLSGLMDFRLPLPIDPALDVVQQVAMGLASAHDLEVTNFASANLVHRDLKPANVLIDVRGMVKVADFGVAQFRDSAYSERSIWGTPPFMSPEQARGEGLDGRSDLFSLGSILFELVCGDRLFPGSDHLEVFPKLQAVEDLIAAREIHSAMEEHAEGLGDVLERCIRFDPELRFADAHELWAALERVRRRVPNGPPLRVLVEECLAFIPQEEHTVTSYEPSWSVEIDSEAGGGTWAGDKDNNLPVGADPFVGRQGELHSLTRLVERARVVTVSGPVGCGKTALARAFCEDARGASFQETWWCALSDEAEPAAISRVLAEVLGVPPGATADHAVVGGRVAQALSSRSGVLVVLDGVDRLIGHLGPVVQGWLDGSDVHVLVTARQPVGAPGEQVLRLGPLSTKEAVELLRARSPVELPESRLRDVAERVDRLPVALEVAAGLLGESGSDTLVARLGSLTDGDLRRGLDSAWGLLGPWERRVLVQLSLFRGGFGYPDYRRVVAVEGVDDPDLLARVLETLLEKSLVRTVARQPEPRFEMLRTLREYLSGHRLQVLGANQAAELRRRYVACFARLGTEVHQLRLWGLQSATALAELRRERGNLLTATRFALDDADFDAALLCARALCWDALAHGLPPGLDQLIEELRGTPDLPAIGSARLLLALGPLLAQDGRDELAREALLEGMALAVQTEARREAGWLRIELAVLEIKRARLEEARDHVEAAHGLSRAIRDRHLEARALRTAALLQTRYGKHEGAERHLSAALTLTRSLGFKSLEARVLDLMGVTALRRGELDRAVHLMQRALAGARELGDRSLEVRELRNLGIVYFRQHRIARARRAMEKAVALANSHGLAGAYDFCLSLGELALEDGRLDEAARHLHEAESLARSQDLPDQLAIVLNDIGLLNVERGRFEAARRALREAEVVIAPTGLRELLVIVLLTRAELELRAGALPDVSRKLEPALALARAVRSPRLEGVALGVQGELAIARGRPKDAARFLDEALDHLAAGDLGAWNDARVRRARVHLLVGEVEEAERHLGEVEGLVDAHGLGPDALIRRKLRAARAQLSTNTGT